MEFDTLIVNGTVVDGTEAPRYKADVGITADRIAAVGELSDSQAGRIIDASGLVVAPGFIDMHSHSDVTMLDDPRGESKAHQGVTTEVTGNCGASPFPAGVLGGPELRRRAPIAPLPVSPTEWEWSDLDGWADRLESSGIGLNVVPQVGHTALKLAAGAPLSRPANDEELATMRRLAAEAVEQGAVAVTNGLTGHHYANAPTSEIAAVVEAVALYENVFYSSHARLWGGENFKAAEEAVEIGRITGVPVNYSHIAIIDSRLHGRAAEMADILEQGRTEGMDVTFDVYPYTAAAASLRTLTTPWMEVGGVEATQARLRDPATRERARTEMERGWWGDIPWDWNSIVISKIGPEGDPVHLGRSVADIARSRNAGPLDTHLDLIVEDGEIESVMHNRTEADMRHFLAHPMSMIGSDGAAHSPTGIWSVTRPHPRHYGTYPRILGRYVRDENVLSLETAVHKMTAAPARRLGLRDRGRVAAGLVADVAVFDPDTVIDRATFEDPHQYPDGVLHVFVNGKPIVADGRHTGALPGRVLRRGQ